jgi:hypothetical protein
VTGASEDPVSLGEIAYRRLRADIVSCRLAPGQRLTERGLAFETGLSISDPRSAHPVPLHNVEASLTGNKPTSALSL